MPGDEAVRAAMAEGYSAIVIDVAGPHAHVVEFGGGRSEGDVG